MRHRVRSQRLGRNVGERKALIKNMARSLILEQRIKTTLAKAKEVRRTVERLVTLGKDGNIASRQRAYKILGSREAVSMLFNQIAPLFKNRSGGYTRILRLSRPRAGDGAQMVFIELTEKKSEPKAERLEEKAKPKKAKIEQKVKVEERPKPKEVSAPEEPKKKHEEPKRKPEEPKKEERPRRGFFEGLKKLFKKEK